MVARLEEVKSWIVYFSFGCYLVIADCERKVLAVVISLSEAVVITFHSASGRSLSFQFVPSTSLGFGYN